MAKSHILDIMIGEAAAATASSSHAWERKGERETMGQMEREREST
jgi:hypothetical protein